MIARLKRNGGPVLLTAAMLVCAGVCAQFFRASYMTAPWTRDGRVSAESVRIAPQVSGVVAGVAVADNDIVHAGDLLFRIGAESFELAVALAEATLDAEREAMEFKASVAARLEASAAISAPSIEQARHDPAAARAQVRGAQVALDMARLDLARTEVRAPVDGYVTNLKLRTGDYVVAGAPSVTVIDAGSFGVTGYFRETQLARIHVGDRVEISLMGAPGTIIGHVESLGRGIADGNGATDADGLPAVDPVLDWVRLAQRMPVRISMDETPEGVFLAAGMTAALSVEGPLDAAR
ncbi:efflux RND transporter periplasmic adaptor subunit [Rhodovulum sp. DZ06]|uniref:efflux RND transporter periplasmic adaptor subunit n=1 Tax=Rhodovulum sp. DZ06 TaxID=3425126 RepID=UPI003D3507AE